MDQSSQVTDAEREIARLADELEQAHTALEASNEEISRLAQDRDHLLVRLTTQARELQGANTAYAHAVSDMTGRNAGFARARNSEADEELRVAFEELQVMTEELEVANTSLHETNRALDQRVEERTLELETKNLALTQSELRFRTLVEGTPQLTWRAGVSGGWTWSSPQWGDYTGQTQRESLGFGWLRACNPDDRAAIRAAWAETHTASLDYEARIFHVQENRYRHHRIRMAPAFTEDGALMEWLGTCTDVDDLVALQARQSVLVAELQHRTRNLMGVVQTTLRRTLQSSRSLEEFGSKIDQRMGALSRVQSLLSRRGDGLRVAFDMLLREEISAHVELDEEGRGDQVTISGPAGVWLFSATVQALALGLHELMTNAVKYGALATPVGRLEVGWSVEDASGGKRRLKVDWRESGVADMPPLNAAPRGGGYGRELIERALPYQLGAKTTYGFADDGVRCTIEVDAAET